MKKRILALFLAMVIADILLFGLCWLQHVQNNLTAGIIAYELTLKPEAPRGNGEIHHLDKDYDWRRVNNDVGTTVFQAAYAYYNEPYTYYCELRGNKLDVYYRLRANTMGGWMENEATMMFLDGEDSELLHKTITIDNSTKKELLEKANEVRAAGGRCPLNKHIVVCDGSHQALYYKNSLYTYNYAFETENYRGEEAVADFISTLSEYLEKNVF